MTSPANSIKIAYEPLRSLPFGTVTTSYIPIGGSFANPARLINVTNLTDSNILISFDGITDHTIVAAGSFFLYDYCSNKSDSGGIFEQPERTQIYAKAESSLPTTGKLYVTVIYASNV